MAAATSTDLTRAAEEELVALARAGRGDAFETLFRRYRDRIAGYVRSTMGDDARTEDLVQEVFLSAHRSLGGLADAGAFKAWLYQIARNTCLDDIRRRSRNEELLFGWDELPGPEERLMAAGPSTHGAVSRKEELAHLRQALDGLPESQHEALVLREVAGMSYDEIGTRMRLSRHAVESVLFRARRGLKGEYSEISTGERCKRMEAVMAEVADGVGALRDRRTLVRHLRDCQSCRREAAAHGLAGLALPSDDRRGLRRAFSRAAAMLPVPAFFGKRAHETEQVAASNSLMAQAQGAASQLSTVGGASADHVSSVIHKAAAVVAAVAVVGGGGVAIEQSGIGIPGIDIVKGKHHQPAAAAGAGAGMAAPSANLKFAGQGGKPPAGTGPDADGPSPLGGVPGSGTQGASSTDATGTAPLVKELPGSTTAPSDPTLPGAGAPVSSDPATPAAPGATAPSSPTKQNGKGKGGGTTTTGGSTGSTDPAPSGSTTGSGGATGDPLPPGIQRKIDSGKLDPSKLPPGLKKKLPPTTDVGPAPVPAA